MAKNKEATVLIEPSPQVVETLRLAATEGKRAELLKRTGVRSELLERWISREEWVPLDVVREACAINRSRLEAPSYSKFLSDCTDGAKFKIVTGEGIERPVAPPVEETVAQRPERSQESTEERGPVKRKRPESSGRIVKVALALFIVPLIGAALGLLVAGPSGAIAAAIVSYGIATVLVFVLLMLIPKRTPGAAQ